MKIGNEKMQKSIKERQRNETKYKCQSLFCYVRKFFLFWFVAGGIFAIVQMSSFALAGAPFPPTDISSELQVSLENWIYGEQTKLPVGGTVDASNLQITPSNFTYLYEGISIDGTILVSTPVPPVKAGNYNVIANYKDTNQMGCVKSTFKIFPKEIGPSMEVTSVRKSFDFTKEVVGEKPTIQLADVLVTDVVRATAIFAYEDMEIGDNKTLLAQQIVLESDSGIHVNYQLTRKELKAVGASIQPISSAYKMSQAVEQLKAIIVNVDTLTDVEKTLIGQAMEQLKQLPEDQKKILKIDTILDLDKLQNKKIGNTVQIKVTPASAGTVTPVTLNIQGITLAAGVTNAGDSILLEITPQKASSASSKMELFLSMTKNGVNQPLSYPLLFTMQLPESIDVSKLLLKHVMGDKTETLEFTNLGNNKISFALFSFSSLLFEERVEPPKNPPSSSEKPKKKPPVDTEAEKEYDFWQALKRNLKKAEDGATIGLDARTYKELPWYIMDVLRDRKTVNMEVKWGGGKTFFIPAGKAPPSDANIVYWPLADLEKIYNKVEVQPVIGIPVVVPPSAPPQKSEVPVPVVEQKEKMPTLEENTSMEDDTVLEETETETETKTKVQTESQTLTTTEEMEYQVKSFCLVDLLTGGRTELGCYWCFIPIIILVSILGIVLIFLQEMSNKSKKE